MTTACIALAAAAALSGLTVSLHEVQILVGRRPHELRHEAQGEIMSILRRTRRQQIATRAAQMLDSGETATDSALHELGLLCAELPKMRREAQLSAVVGQDLFEAAGRAYAAMAEARRQIIQVHDGFERVRVQLDLAPVTAGQGTDKPDSDVSPGLADAA